MNPILWQPQESDIAKAQITAFISLINRKYNFNLKEYAELYDWSVEQMEDFWQSLAEFFQIEFVQSASKILQAKPGILGSEWFLDASLNYAQHCLRFNDERLAISFYTEAGLRQELSYQELNTLVAQAQAGLKKLGVEQGDRVAAVLPNVPETIIAMLATTSLGAIWSSCSPDFGVQAIQERFSQIKPKVLFVCSEYLFKGKQIDCRDKITALQLALPGLQQMVEVFWPEQLQQNLSNSLSWQDFLLPAENPEFLAVPFAHPAFILFSSGTTGKPKCIVHGHGGTLLQHMKELGLHTDLQREDKLLYVTSCGWMMWNWMVSGLTLGANLILFEGSPVYPEVDSFLGILQQAGVSVFGTSAKYLHSLERVQIKAPGLPALRTILSTGSPLASSTFEYVYENISKDICLSSISGGTDIISCFALGCPILPVRAGELQCRGLGMAVQVFDEQGRAVVEQKGELVCVKPFPSMPVCFWDDPDNKKYFSAYFSKFKNTWTHGDYAMLTICSGIMIFGRSDAVLNPGGVRIGTAEIYQAVESLSQIKESLAIGQRFQGDERIVLFVVLQPDLSLDEALKQEIKQIIRVQASPRHVPAEILQVSDLPRTVNGKLSELAVKRIIHGETLGNEDALLNPECLHEFKALLDKS
jgi:acetoacetyl-CoA synthetase